MVAESKPTILRGHHLNAFHHIQRGVDEIIRALAESGYKDVEAMRPAAERLRALRENPDALVRFQLGYKDFLCKSCKGAKRCPDNPWSDVDRGHIDKKYLERSDIIPGKDYTVREILAKIDQRLSTKKYL